MSSRDDYDQDELELRQSGRQNEKIEKSLARIENNKYDTEAWTVGLHRVRIIILH